MANKDNSFHSKPCVVCGKTFFYIRRPGKDDPDICGYVPCRARHEWTDEDWAQAAKFARIRVACGLPLVTDLSVEALERYPVG